MSWAAILVLAAGAYVFKATGLLVFGDSDESSLGIRIGRLLPPALLTALIVVSTFGATDGKGLALDARAAGIAAAAVAVVCNLAQRAQPVPLIGAGTATVLLASAEAELGPRSVTLPPDSVAILEAPSVLA